LFRDHSRYRTLFHPHRSVAGLIQNVFKLQEPFAFETFELFDVLFEISRAKSPKRFVLLLKPFLFGLVLAQDGLRNRTGEPKRDEQSSARRVHMRQMSSRELSVS
jgi:hypothetical protein